MSDEGMGGEMLERYARGEASVPHQTRPFMGTCAMTLQERLDAAEREREAFAERVFRHGFSDGWTANQKGRLAASASVDEAWHFYVADGALQKSVALTANHSAPQEQQP